MAKVGQPEWKPDPTVFDPEKVDEAPFKLAAPTVTRAATDARLAQLLQEREGFWRQRESGFRDELKAAMREKEKEDAYAARQKELREWRPGFLQPLGETFTPDASGEAGGAALPSVALSKSKSVEAGINDEMAAELASLALAKKRASDAAQTQKIKELQGAPERIVAAATGQETV